MLTVYLLGAVLMTLIYLLSHGWSLHSVDYIDICMVLLWPLTLAYFFYQLFYENR